MSLRRSLQTISSLCLKRIAQPARLAAQLQQRSFSACVAQRSGGLSFKHYDSPENTADTPFDFTPASYEEVYKILAKYPPYGKQSAIIPLLHLAQRQVGGFVPLAAMQKIADIVGQPVKKVYEVVTFYVMFNREPVGKYHIQVCVTTPCMIRGSDDILATIENHLGIKLGETTSDKIFTLGEMECMGCCVNAPMIVVSDYSNPPEFRYDFYEDLDAEKTIAILESLKNGVMPPIGPQNGRQNAMPIGGRTSLFEPPRGPYCRNIDEQPPAAGAPEKK